MNGCPVSWRLLVGVITAVLLAGCASGASSTPGPATPAPTVAATSPRPPTFEVKLEESSVTYESANPVVTPDALDVYAPAKAGPWPVVVMFHGAPGSDPATDRGYLSENARRVAELGFVVFNASWGHTPAVADMSWHDGLLATQSQGACAVEFARANAAEYGGDPATIIVFGHSGGAQTAAMVAFARPEPAVGCRGGTALGAIDALVTYEGNWLLSTNMPDWDGVLADDPTVMDAITPWKYLAGHADQKVVMLVSEDPKASLESEFPGLIVDRPVGDPWAADSWLAVRDPSGDLRRQLKANGALADGTVGQADADRLLFSVLEAQGNPVSLDVMPGSSHAYLSDAGWKVFLAAFPKAAAKD